MVPVALAFAVLDLTGSAVALGQVLAARTAAMLVFLLVGGVIADRLPRTLVIQVGHAVTALSQGYAAYLFISGSAQLWMIVVIEAVNGAVSAFTFPAMTGVVPQLVERPLIQQANAVLDFVFSTLSIIGPAVAGVLVKTVGPGWALAVDAATYVVAIALLVPVRLPPRDQAGTSSMLRDLHDGWREFTARTWVWVIVAVFGVLNAVHAGAIGVLGPLVATTTPLGEAGWGLALSAEAGGVLLGTVLLMRAPLAKPLRAGMVGVAVGGLFFLALGLTPVLVVLVPLAILTGLGIQIFEVGWTTSLQQHVPEQTLSRVSSYDALGSFIAMPVGTFVFGLLGTHLDPGTVLVASGVAFTAGALLTLLVPSVRGLRAVHRLNA